MSQLIENTNMLLVDTVKKKKGVDFCVSCLSWVYLKLSPLYENIKTSERYIGALILKCMLHYRAIQNSFHTHKHWTSIVKTLAVPSLSIALTD